MADSRVALFWQKNTKRKQLELDNEEDIELLRSMYKVAQNLKTMRWQTILDQILNQGFQSSCQGYHNNKDIGGTAMNRRKVMLDHANSFCKAGQTVARIVLGENHKTTKLWERRKLDPMESFLREIDERKMVCSSNQLDCNG